MKATERQHLIAVGNAPAVRAEDLQVGMYRRFNYDLWEQIVKIEPKGSQSLDITVRIKKTGALFSRTVRKSTVIAVITDRDLNVRIDPVPES